MNRNSTLIGLLCLGSILFRANSASATNYVDNGTATTYTLAAGDSLHIASGTYTGIINGFPAGAKISVAAGATFQPSSMAFPNVRGTLYVYGTFVMNAQLRTNTGFIIHNYGLVWAKSTTLMSGTTQVWNNYFAATMNLDGDVSMTADNGIINQGTINCGANLTMTGSTFFTNKLNVNIAGNYLNSGGTVTNQGRWYVKGSITFNNGLAIINNYCRMIAESGIYNTTGQMNNYGFTWSKSSPGTGVLVNSGTIVNGPGAVILAISLNNTGTIRGAGYMHFTGYTTTTNSGTTGVNGITADTIRMFDASRSNINTIYDNQTGTVYPNVKFQQFADLDSNRTYIGGCSLEMVSQIPLAVNWNYFFAALKSNVPVLDWSAKADPGTRFIVQRSYDGHQFITINEVTASVSAPVYAYTDRDVNTKAAVVYYRIAAVEPNGDIKFSAIKSIRFSQAVTTPLQTAPNPFTSTLTINYQSPGAAQVRIRLLSMTGQQQWARLVNVHSGINNVSINDASSLPRGMYLVQVIHDNKLMASERIIKQ